VIIELIRDDDPSQKHNWGKFFVDRLFFGETLEDKDRHLEAGGEKVYGDTAIPRGRYRVTLSMSRRFGRNMPEIHDVPGFTGVRIHGGNTEHDTLGCPLLGQTRTATGIANCKGVNDRLYVTLLAAEQRCEEVWLEVS
jgi:hypothetical protein